MTASAPPPRQEPGPAPPHPPTALSTPGVRVLLIGTGDHPGPTLTPVPAAPRTVRALAERLVERCGVLPGQLRTLIDPADARTMAEHIATEVQLAETTLLIHYVGHGLVGPNDELHLAARATDRLTPGLAGHQALSLTSLCEALSVCRASSVIVILDCCFSGRAVLDTRPAPQPPSLSLPPGHGLYLLGSAEQLALAPEDAEFTTFTGELIRLLDDGVPRGPRLLTLNDIYEHLFRTFHSRGGPLPRRQAGDRSGSLVITVNRAAAPAAVPGPRTADENEAQADEPPPAPCPYPGLESFSTDEAAYFHGRDALTAELLAACGRSLDHGQPVVLVGPSGAGKTSLLNAGLLATLHRGHPDLPGSTRWRCVTLTPGEHPVHSLRAALPTAEATAEATTEATAEAATEATPETTAKATAPLANRLVIVVDQLEELFTLCQVPREQTEFIATLTTLAEAGALVVTSLRADFYGRAQELPALAAALRDQQVQAGPMREEELRAAIELPARATGLELEEGLPDLLLRDMGVPHAPSTATHSGALPLLAHALLAAWREGDGRRITLADYGKSGGIERAIARTADTTYARQSEAGRAAVRLMFPRLVRIDDRTVDTIRTVDRAVLLAGVSDPEAAERALHAFAKARLLVLDKETVSFCHNALLHTWPALRDWIGEDRDWLRTRQRVTADADAWQSAHRDPSLLYRGNPLTAAEEWAAGPAPHHQLTDLEREFIAAGSAAERRRVRVRNVVVAGIAALVTVALVAGGLAFLYGRQADARARTARAGQLAAQSQALAASRPESSMLHAIEAFRKDSTSLEARSALLGSRNPYFLARLDANTSSAGPLAFDPDGGVLATGDSEFGVTLWNVRTRERIRVIRNRPRDKFDRMSGGITDLAFSPDGRLLAVATYQEVRVWDMAAGRFTARPFKSPTPWSSASAVLGVKAIAFSPDGRFLAASVDRAQAQIWDVRERRGLTTAHGFSKLGTLAFASDSRTLTVYDVHGLHRWDVVHGRTVRSAATGDPAWTPSTVDPSGRTLAVVHDEKTVRLWNTAEGTVTRSLPVAQVAALALGPRGEFLATSGNDGAIRLWDLATGQVRATFTGHTGVVRGMAFSADGRTLATTGDDGTTILWGLDRSTFVPAGAEATGRPVFSPTGSLLAVAADDGTVRLWDTTGRRRVRTLHLPGTGAVRDLAFRSDGRVLMTCDEARKVRLWDVASLKLTHTITVDVGPVQQVAFRPGKRFVAVAARDVEVWDVVADKKVTSALLAADRNLDVPGMEFGPDGSTLALSIGDGGGIGLWRADRLLTRSDTTGDATYLGTMEKPYTDGNAGVAFSPDSRLLATAAIGSNDVLLWDTRTHKVRTTLTGHTGVLRSLAFSPDGRTLVSTSDDRTVRLWNVSDGSAYALLNNSTIVSGAAFSADGRFLATVEGGTVRLRETDPDRVVEDMCRTIGAVDRDGWRELAPDLPYDGHAC
ncbi:WD-40 repeat-containing protein [Actinobacteria bacterium OK074]|nr:WD-40 repeat-containing protein [Actinobacteria bacterium OK074]